MTPALAVDLVRKAVMLTMAVSAPILLTALAVGIVITLIQALTQLQEQTLTFIPKLIAMSLVLVVTLPWVLRELVEFLVGSMRSLPGLVH